MSKEDLSTRYKITRKLNFQKGFELGDITIIGENRTKKPGRNGWSWLCHCKNCNKNRLITEDKLRRENTIDCGCRQIVHFNS